MTHQTVLVVDFGGQYTQLIVRRVREFGIYSEMVPWTQASARIAELKPSAVVLSGGPKSVFEAGAPNLDFSLLDGVPTLGICYGHQLMAARLGGTVEAIGNKEYGYRTLENVHPASLVGELASNQVWMSHGTQVLTAPAGFEITASTDSCPVAAFENVAEGKYGVQFHPEVTHTADGRTVLRRFLFDRADLRGDWTSESFIDEEVAKIRETVGDGKVLCAVSGGVDSSVMAALLIRAIGDRAVCVFVDHGLLRKGEAEQVEETFLGHFKANLKVFHELDRFFTALAGEKDPERKRKIVGENFVKVFEEHAEELRGCDFWPRAPFIPTLSKADRPPPPRSRRTTTLEDCPNGCGCD